MQRAIALLGVFGAADLGAEPELSLTSIATHTGLPVSTTYRLAQALQHAGLLERAPDGERYRIGAGLVTLAAPALSRHPHRAGGEHVSTATEKSTATIDSVPSDDPVITAVAGHIGAEVSGVDLRGPLTPAQVDSIRTALHAYKVLFFADQHIDHAAQIAFTKQFGQVTPAHPYDDDAPDEFPEILAVDSRKYAERFGSRKYSYDSRWHTDVTALINPPAGTVLRADVVPDRGGDTQWTNLVAAYQGLPAPIARLADELRAEHRFGGRKPQWSQDGTFARKQRDNPIVTEHPVVRVHPVTGERALFVTPGFTSRIVGVSPAQSDRLLDLFFDEITNPAYTVRFRWRSGSVAFWDNRATAHLAPTDLDHLDVTRVLYRTTLEGDVPVGPDGAPSVSLAGSEFRGTT